MGDAAEELNAESLHQRALPVGALGLGCPRAFSGRGSGSSLAAVCGLSRQRLLLAPRASLGRADLSIHGTWAQR